MSAFSKTFPIDKRHALYLMHSGRVVEAIEYYQDCCMQTGEQDFEIVQQTCLILLHQGAYHPYPQIILLSIFGAGLAAYAFSLEILETGITSPYLETQLISLNFISQFQDDRSNKLFYRAFNSDYLLTRMEALFQMAMQKHPPMVGQMESLMNRLPNSFKPFFPQLFALTGTSEAIAMVRKLINDSLPMVRVEVISSIAHFQRDDFLSILRVRATH